MFIQELFDLHLHILNRWKISWICNGGSYYSPAAFCWVQLRRIWWKKLHFNIAVQTIEIFPYCRWFMVGGIIKEEDIGACRKLFNETWNKGFKGKSIERDVPFIVEFFTIDKCAKDVNLLVTPEENTAWSFSFYKPDSSVNWDKSERRFIKCYNLKS